MANQTERLLVFTVVTVLPWNLKFIVAPLMDRYTYLPMGRKRPWILLGQIGLVVSFIYMAYIPNPLNNLNQLMMAGFIVPFFGAFQDVATDGMAAHFPIFIQRIQIAKLTNNYSDVIY
jgi:MFS transporter, PAT family, beta-lactamase induction signal transducer AmpG